VTAARPRALAGLTVCVALWGMVFVAVHELLPVMGAVQMVTLRFLLASAVFIALMASRADWRPHFSRREWLLCIAAGVLAVPGTQLAVVEGQRYLAPPIASLIVTTSPVVAAALGAAFLSERFSRRNLVGFGVALAGVAMIVILGAGTGADAQASDPLRASITVIGPIAWAIYTLVSKPVSDVHPAVPVVGVAVIAGTLSLTPAIPHALSGLGELSGASWGWMLYMVFGGTLAPYLLWSSSLKRLDVSRTASFMYLVPVFATGWSVLLLGSALTAVTLLGGAVVLGGVVLTQRA
jgi:drug/metabolite transporter (DMT)-like permease